MNVLELAELAASQWGMVTTAQATHAGHARQTLSRLADQGALERLSHGIYRITGTPPGPLDELRAAWLALDPSRTVAERLRNPAAAAVSHRSAANLHALGDVDADQYEFTMPTRKQSRRPDIRLHRGTLDNRDCRVIDGLPVTGLVRTIQDLAASRLDGGHLAGVVRDALTKQHVDLDAVSEALRPYAHHYGAPLGDGEALVTQFLHEAGLPDTTRQVVALTDASLFASPDLAAILETLANNPATTARLAAVFDAMRPGLDHLATTQLARTTEAFRSMVASSPIQQQMAAAAEAVRPALKRLEATSGAREQAAAMTERMRPALESAANLVSPETRATLSQAARLAALEGGDRTE